MTRVLLLLALPNALFSAAMVQHSTSLTAALVYLVGAPLAMVAVLRPLGVGGVSSVLDCSPRLGLVALLVFLVVAAGVFAVVYPIADARRAARHRHGRRTMPSTSACGRCAAVSTPAPSAPTE